MDTRCDSPCAWKMLAVSSSIILCVACGSGAGGGVVVSSPSGSTEQMATPEADDDPAGSREDSRQLIPTTEASAWRPNSPWADVIARCVLVDSIEESCPLSTLPFIGTGDRDPTHAEILDRLLVTHDWMGQRFAELLVDAPDELVRLFGSTTAIVIGSHVRPSNYNSLHGAIQLDPALLWLSRDEKRTVSTEEDYRSGFGADLQFMFFSRWAIGETRAWTFFDLADDSERQLSDIRLPTMQLLYHELAHANDFMPRDQLSRLDPGDTVYEAIHEGDFEWLNQQLARDWPLTSDELKKLAAVRYRGEQPGDSQLSVQADYAGALMNGDAAARLYSYYTDAEDLATAFAMAMMYRHHGVSLNIGYVVKPADLDNVTCDDLEVGWGVRNRLADPAVLTRSVRLLKRLANTPETALRRMVSDLQASPQVLMRAGESWCTNHQGLPLAKSARTAAQKETGVNLMRERDAPPGVPTKAM